MAIAAVAGAAKARQNAGAGGGGGVRQVTDFVKHSAALRRTAQLRRDLGQRPTGPQQSFRIEKNDDHPSVANANVDMSCAALNRDSIPPAAVLASMKRKTLAAICRDQGYLDTEDLDKGDCMFWLMVQREKIHADREKAFADREKAYAEREKANRRAQMAAAGSMQTLLGQSSFKTTGSRHSPAAGRCRTPMNPAGVRSPMHGGRSPGRPRSPMPARSHSPMPQRARSPMQRGLSPNVPVTIPVPTVERGDQQDPAPPHRDGARHPADDDPDASRRMSHDALLSIPVPAAPTAQLSPLSAEQQPAAAAAPGARRSPRVAGADGSAPPCPGADDGAGAAGADAEDGSAAAGANPLIVPARPALGTGWFGGYPAAWSAETDARGEGGDQPATVEYGIEAMEEGSDDAEDDKVEEVHKAKGWFNYYQEDEKDKVTTRTFSLDNLTRADVNLMQTLYSQNDDDSSGTLDFIELHNLWARAFQTSDDEIDQICGFIFADIDRDGDQEITWDELKGYLLGVYEEKEETEILLLAGLSGFVRANRPISWRHWLWAVMEQSASDGYRLKWLGWISFALSTYIQVLIIAATVNLVLNSISTLSDQTKENLVILEYICSVSFTIEFILRCSSCPVTVHHTDEGYLISQRQFWTTAFTWIDVLAVLPFWLDETGIIGNGGSFVFVRVVRLVRLARVMRMFKAGRHSAGVQLLMIAFGKCKLAIAWMCILLIMASVLFASMMFFTEQQDAEEDENGIWVRRNSSSLRDAGDPIPFQSILEGMWWAVGTLTTGGYGDIIPYTDAGKAVAALCMVTNLLLNSYPITIICITFGDVWSAYASACTRKARRRRLLTAIQNNSHSKDDRLHVANMRRMAEKKKEDARVRKELADALGAGGGMQTTTEENGALAGLEGIPATAIPAALDILQKEEPQARRGASPPPAAAPAGAPAADPPAGRDQQPAPLP